MPQFSRWGLFTEGWGQISLSPPAGAPRGYGGVFRAWGGALGSMPYHAMAAFPQPGPQFQQLVGELGGADSKHTLCHTEQ